MAVPSYYTRGETVAYYAVRVFVGLVLLFLISPILVIIPLSFNAEPYFTFTAGMLSFDPEAYSLRWYNDFFTSEEWLHGIKNSFIIAIASTFLATAKDKHWSQVGATGSGVRLGIELLGQL